MSVFVLNLFTGQMSPWEHLLTSSSEPVFQVGDKAKKKKKSLGVDGLIQGLQTTVGNHYLPKQ